MTQTAARRPLEGLRVADFTWFGAGANGELSSNLVENPFQDR